MFHCFHLLLIVHELVADDVESMKDALYLAKSFSNRCLSCFLLMTLSPSSSSSSRMIPVASSKLLPCTDFWSSLSSLRPVIVKNNMTLQGMRISQG